MRRSRGFTITEMMVALAVVGATAALTVQVGGGVAAEQRQADAVARDVGAVGKALRLAADDVRAGVLVERGWTLEKDVLSRDGVVVARGVREWVVKAEGGATRLSITVVRHGPDPGTHGALTVAEVVRPRAGAAP